MQLWIPQEDWCGSHHGYPAARCRPSSVLLARHTPDPSAIACAPALEVEGVEAVGVEGVGHVADAVRAGVIVAVLSTGTPGADSRTIWARRHVTTDPGPRRMIGNSCLPSSIVRTRTPPAT